MANIQRSQIIPGPRFEVYNYATSAETLAEQLAGAVDVKWQNPGIELAAGSEFLFVMTRYGVEQPIRFIVDKFVTGHSLTYRQMSGVFGRYIHHMKFDEHDSSETVITDLMEYELPFGLIGRIADDFYFRKEMGSLLEHRLNNIRKFFINKEENAKSSTAVETSA